MRVSCDTCNKTVMDHNAFTFHGSDFIKALLEDFEKEEINEFITEKIELNSKTIKNKLKFLFYCPHTFCYKCLQFDNDWEGWPNYEDTNEYKFLFLKTLNILMNFKCLMCN